MTELVDVLDQGRLPRAAELDPYTLGVVPSAYGNAASYGKRDEYIHRIADQSLVAVLRPGRLVVVAGSSAVGKTRTAFEVMRAHRDWGDALVAAPPPGSLLEFAEHPAVHGSDPLVVWLDDLPRFLAPAGVLSQAIITRLFDRRGPAVLLATIDAAQWQLLQSRVGELTSEARNVLDNATSIEIGSIRDDPTELARAAAVYPEVGISMNGLAETLAGVPQLLRLYRSAATTDPLLRALVQVCVDWVRCGSHARSQSLNYSPSPATPS